MNGILASMTTITLVLFDGIRKTAAVKSIDVLFFMPVKFGRLSAMLEMQRELADGGPLVGSTNNVTTSSGTRSVGPYKRHRDPRRCFELA